MQQRYILRYTVDAQHWQCTSFVHRASAASFSYGGHAGGHTSAETQQKYIRRYAVDAQVFSYNAVKAFLGVPLLQKLIPAILR